MYFEKKYNYTQGICHTIFVACHSHKTWNYFSLFANMYTTHSTYHISFIALQSYTTLNLPIVHQNMYFGKNITAPIPIKTR